MNQPIAAAVTNAQAALRWLGARPPNLEEVREALRRIVENATRASDVIGRIRALIKKAPPRKDGLEINDAVLEVIALTHGETVKTGVSVQTQLAKGLPLIQGDRVQLQQVILNLIVNAVEAMNGAAEGSRKLLISTSKPEANGVLVAVGDSGPGLAPDSLDRAFDAFYTTKARRIGYGSIDQPFDCRSSWRTLMGDGKPAARCGLSIHSARTSGRGVVIWRAPAATSGRRSRALGNECPEIR